MKVLQFTVPVADNNSVVIQEDMMPFFYHYLHRHKEIQITLVLRGEGTLIVGNYTQPFKAGEVYLIGANQPHLFKGDAKYFEGLEEKNIHAIHLFFDPCVLKQMLSLPEFNKVKQFVDQFDEHSLHLPAIYEQRACELIKGITELAGLQRLWHFTNLLAFFATDVSGFKSLDTGISANTYSDVEGIIMNDIFQYTIENYAENITLEKVSAIAKLTPHAFCKHFKRHTRKTYLSFLNELRVNEACKILLQRQSDSIATVAYATGFNNVITFNRVFKKVMKMSPSEYVKAYKFKKSQIANLA